MAIIHAMFDCMRFFARLSTVLFLALYVNAFAYTTSNINLVDAQSLVFNADSLVDSMTKHLPNGHDLPFAHSNADLSDGYDKNLFDVDDKAEAPLIMAVLSWQLLKNKFPLHLAGVDLQFDSVLLRVPIL